MKRIKYVAKTAVFIVVVLFVFTAMSCSSGSAVDESDWEQNRSESSGLWPRHTSEPRYIPVSRLHGGWTPESVLNEMLYPEGVQFETPQNQNALRNVINSRQGVQAMHSSYFEVFISDIGFEVYFLCRRTGHIHPTNPVFLDYPSAEIRTELFGATGGFTDMQRVLYSQLDIVYYVGDERREMWSFPDVVSPQRHRAQWETGFRYRYDEHGNSRRNPTLTVTYTMGANIPDFGVMLAMTPETYYYIYDRLLDLVDIGLLTLPEMRVFPNLHTPITYQEILDGRTGFDPIFYRERYPNLPYLGTVYMLKPFSNRQYNDLLWLYGLAGITTERILEEEELFGRAPMGEMYYFRIPLVYELDGNSILMYIDTARITQSDERLTLSQININRTFGAARPTDSGYIFAPYNGGVLVANDEPVAGEFSAAFDPQFPVFGIRRGFYRPVQGVITYAGSVGTVAIVEQGANFGGFHVHTVENPDPSPGEFREHFGGDLPYNMVFPYVTLFEATTNFEFTIRYNFLYDELSYIEGWQRFIELYIEHTGADMQPFLLQ